MRSWLGVKRARVAHEELLAQCKSAASHRAAARAWAKWREAFLTRIVVNPYRSRVKVRLVTGVLWALKENAQYCLAKKELFHTAVRMWRQQRMRLALRGWRGYTGYKSNMTRLETSAVKMHRGHVLRRVLRDWEDEVDVR